MKYMGIDLQQTRTQASKISSCALNLNQVKNVLLLYKNRLSQSWNAEEMYYINMCIDQLMQRISNLSSELNRLSSDVNTAANEVKREEDLAAAKAVLANASAAFDRAKQNYIRIQNLYYNNPSEAMSANLESAKKAYYVALNNYNAASSKVRSLS